MVKPFLCGSTSFNHHEVLGECSSQRKLKRFCSRRREIRNPWSGRGQDKFYALLAEIEQHRQRIYTHIGSQQVCFICFDCSNSDRCKPIVVRLREKTQQKSNAGDHHQGTKNNSQTGASSLGNADNSEIQLCNIIMNSKNKEKKNFYHYSWELKRGMWGRPYCYLPAIITLILFFLALFGRAFAVCCMSIGWYLLATIPDVQKPRKIVKKNKTPEDLVATK